jgi:hypothetical protein
MAQFSGVLIRLKRRDLDGKNGGAHLPHFIEAIVKLPNLGKR